MKYSNYRYSRAWQSKHDEWLKLSNNRCQLFPWVRVGRVNGKYYKYNVHHLHRNAYRRQNRERWQRDVIVLCPFAHKFVFHWLLSGGKTTVGEQKDFPNFAQRSLNWWCRLIGIMVKIPAPLHLIALFVGLVVLQNLKASL